MSQPNDYAGPEGGTVAVWPTWIPPVSVPGRQEQKIHVLLWQVRGDADLVVDGKDQALPVGHALWVPAGARHEFTVHANSVTLPLFFEAAETATILCEPTVVGVDRDLRTLMLAYTASSNSIIKPQVDLARQILARIEQGRMLWSQLPVPDSEPAMQIAEALRFNPGDPRSVDELAASVHTSARTIRRAFLAETGMSVRQWRIRNRIEAAAILLRGSATVDAIAHRVGYLNVNAFRRVFQDHVGISPTEYIARYRAR